MSLKTKLERNMAELFDLPEEEEVVATPEKSEEVVSNKNQDAIDQDFESSRKHIDELLTTGSEALQYALSVAKQSDDPKAYQVVANIITQLANINEQKIDIHLLSQKYKNNEHWKKENKNPQLQTVEGALQLGAPANVTNNAIFVGSSAELSKIIKMQLGNNEHDVTD